MKIRETYSRLFSDMAEKKRFLISTVVVFSLAIVLSTMKVPELEKTLSEVLNAVRGMALDLRNSSVLYVIGRIFVHNAIAAFIALFSGVLLFLIPVAMIFVNGYVIGFVMIPRLSELGKLIPHGVFELPALALACSYGIWLGLWPFKSGRIKNIKYRLKQAAAMYFFVVLPLLLIAASIEGSLIKFMPIH